MWMYPVSQQHWVNMHWKVFPIPIAMVFRYYPIWNFILFCFPHWYFAMLVFFQWWVKGESELNCEVHWASTLVLLWTFQYGDEQGIKPETVFHKTLSPDQDHENDDILIICNNELFLGSLSSSSHPRSQIMEQMWKEGKFHSYCIACTCQKLALVFLSMGMPNQFISWNETLHALSILWVLVSRSITFSFKFLQRITTMKHVLSFMQETVNSLLLLLSWSWDTFKEAAAELSHLSSESLGYSASYHDVERLVYICQACLRLLRAFIEEMFPLGGE